MQIRKR